MDNLKILFEHLYPDGWISYLQNPTDNDPLLVTYLFPRIAKQASEKIDYESFMDIVGKNELNEYGKRMLSLFEIWKADALPNELRKANHINMFLTDKNMYPKCMLPLSRGDVKNKARWILRNQEHWRVADRLFFMLVFKFSKVSEREIPIEEPSGEQDPNLRLYQQASNGLWDFIAYLDSNSRVQKCSVHSKRKMTLKHMKQVWLDWLEEQGTYNDFLTYEQISAGNQRESARVQLFVHFLFAHQTDRACWSPMGEMHPFTIKI